MKPKQLLLFGLLASLFGCEPTSPPNSENERVEISNVATRWYQSGLLELGERVYEAQCQKCHGEKATGSSDDWHRAKENGRFPAPPLNGTAHAWHHPLPILLKTIDEGSIAQGGEMPAFKETLNMDQKLGVIAYFQQFWPDEIYTHWETNFPKQFEAMPRD